MTGNAIMLYNRIINEQANAEDFINFSLIFMTSKNTVDNDKLLEKIRKEAHYDD